MSSSPRPLRWVHVGWLLLAACLSSPSTPCGDRICPGGQVCVGGTQCAQADQAAACVAPAVDGEPCTTTQISDGTCQAGVCVGKTCGDGRREDPEQCEAGQPLDTTCTDLGFYAGDLACGGRCLFDTSACAEFCGDDLVNGPELCDGDLAAASCLDYGFEAGLASCSPACGVALQDCELIGWGLVSSVSASSLEFLTSTEVIVSGNLGLVQLDLDSGAIAPIASRGFVRPRHRGGPLYVTSTVASGAGETHFAHEVVAGPPVVLAERASALGSSQFQLLPLADGFAIVGQQETTPISDFSVSRYDAAGTLLWQRIAAFDDMFVAAGTRIGRIETLGGERAISIIDEFTITPIATVPNVSNDLSIRDDDTIWSMVHAPAQYTGCEVRQTRAGVTEVRAHLRARQNGCQIVADQVGRLLVRTSDELVAIYDDGRTTAWTLPTTDSLAAAGQDLLLGGAAVRRLGNPRWQRERPDPRVISLSAYEATDEALLLQRDGVVATSGPGGEQAWTSADGVEDACRRGDAVVTGGQDLQEAGALLIECSQPGNCASIVRSPGPDTFIEISCSVDRVWGVMRRSGFGLPSQLAFSFDTTLTESPAGVVAVRALSNGEGLVLFQDDARVELAHGTTAATLTTLHAFDQGTRVTDVAACSADAWFVSEGANIHRASGGTVVVETLPSPDPIRKLLADDTCTSIWALGSRAAYQRMADGRWRPVTYPLEVQDAPTESRHLLVDGAPMLFDNDEAYSVLTDVP